MQNALQVGDRVRVSLHGRKVGGFVAALGLYGTVGFTDISPDKLSPVLKRSGAGVLPHLVPLVRDVARANCGPRRAVMKSASSPRNQIRHGVSQHGMIADVGDPTARDVVSRPESVVVAQVAPLHSVISIVSELARTKPVLVVCPTVRMAVMGAAALRRHGCKVALVPEDWEQALSGVDVVIGPRSAVWAPCPNVGTIVVVDEHDDSLQEERVPTWHARDVAMQRAQIESARCIMTSPVPSVIAMRLAGAQNLSNTSSAGFVQSTGADGWPNIEIADLSEISVRGSLATSQLLQVIREANASVLCILNTKGRARLLACRNCRNIARCAQCDSVLRTDDKNTLWCDVCSLESDAVCSQCGRTAFLTLRTGITQLREELTKAANIPVTEVDASTSVESLGVTAGVFIGTEALLHRVPSANHVIFLDFDMELLAPHVTAARDALSLLIKASRVVGKKGRIVVQSRCPEHQLLQAVTRLSHDANSLEGWAKADLMLRKSLQLPPFTELARISGEDPTALESTLRTVKAHFAREGKDSFLLKAHNVQDMAVLVDLLRSKSAQRLRVEIGPSRY